MIKNRLPGPTIETIILFIGVVASIIVPVIIVPLALTLALIAFTLNRFKKKDPGVPGIREIFLQGKVIFTTRVVLLLLFGTLPLMVVNSHFAAVAVFLVFNTIVAALIIADVVITPRPENLLVQRIVQNKLSIGQKNIVKVVIVNKAYTDIQVEVKDEYPKEFEVNASEIKVKLPRRSETTFQYEVVPLKRGCYYFKDTSLKFRGVLDLIIYQQPFGHNSRVEVYPDISSISKFELLMRRSHLLETGLVNERRRGTGTDFESLREYIKGDEFRKIDWKASARRNKLIAREYQSEVNQSVLILLDCSRSTGALAGKITMLDHAVNGALLLGYQVLRKGDKIGLMTFSDRVHASLPPKGGKNHYYSFVQNLYAVKPSSVEPSYENVLDKLSKSRLKRSMIIMITDTATGESANKLFSAIPVIIQKHLLIVISLLDPLIKSYSRRIPEKHEEVYQKIVAREQMAKIEQLNKKIELMGAITAVVTPEQLKTTVLSKYLKAKLRSRL